MSDLSTAALASILRRHPRVSDRVRLAAADRLNELDDQLKRAAAELHYAVTGEETDER
jgi:hypothetical protein